MSLCLRNSPDSTRVRRPAGSSAGTTAEGGRPLETISSQDHRVTD